MESDSEQQVIRRRKQVLLRLSVDEYAALREAAAEEQRSLSALGRIIISRVLAGRQAAQSGARAA